MEDIASLSDNEWIINGKVYDLRGFLNKHPGGPTILNMNRKRDCTELFETYHFISSKRTYIDSTLKTYFVRNANHEEIGSLYDWDDIQYKEMKINLKNKVSNYFKQNNIISYKANNMFKSLYLIEFLLLIINIYFYFEGYWISIIFISILSWIFSGDIIHCGLHYSIFANYFMNELVSYIFGWYHCTFCVWYFQHTISHHSYTNIDEYDADLCWHEDVWYDQDLETNDTETNFIKYKHSNKNVFKLKVAVMAAPLTSFVPILSIINPLWELTRWIYLRWRFIKFQMFITYIQTFVAMIFIPILLIYKIGTIKGFAFFFIPRFIHGIIYHIFSQINHINKISFQNTKLQKTKNFIIHQILSTCDYSIDSYFIGFISLGLNNHSIHHLFPNIHPCHYPKLSKIIKAFCKQYHIKQSIHNNLIHAITSHMNYLFRINVK